MKKISIFLLALLSCAGITQAAIFDGSCGANLTWSLNTEDSTLTITGSGEMTNWHGDPDFAPWYDCKSYIKYVSLPDGITSIGEWAFRDCSGLTSIEIPNRVTSIGSDAFDGCSGLTSVTIGNRVTSIGNTAFSYCTGLTSVTIPNSVTSIGDYAFYECYHLTSVTIGNSVTSIGSSAFGGCSSMTSVTIPSSVTIIGEGAFLLCKGLTSVTIPNSVTSIGGSVFSGCSGLTSVTIGNSVTSIGDKAFKDCSGLTSVTNYATTPQSINSNVFDNVNKSTCVLNVPKESVSLYQAANVWKEFTNKTVEGDYTINYVDKDSQALYNHVVTLYVPVAPTIEGFTFVGWKASGMLSDGITLQAVYQADAPTSAPAVYTNPANPAQKLIKNGNVYILTDDKTYTITGQQVK